MSTARHRSSVRRFSLRSQIPSSRTKNWPSSLGNSFVEWLGRRRTLSCCTSTLLPYSGQARSSSTTRSFSGVTHRSSDDLAAQSHPLSYVALQSHHHPLAQAPAE